MDYQFKEVAEETEKENSQGPSDDPLSSFMTENPNEFSRNYTYWKFNIEARDQDFAIDQLEIILEYLLGKLNFAAHSGTTEGISIDNSFWPSGWSDLKLPFLYFVFEDDEYIQFYYSEDFTPRDKFSVHSIRRSQFDRYLDEFPGPEQPYNELEETFVDAVRTFQTAISEPNREDSFLEYWRCTEQLTLANEDDDMKTVIRRASAPLEHENPELFRFRLQRAREKRNKLVHESPDVSIDKEDQNRLKSVLDHLIDLYIEKFDDWDTKDFEFYLDNVGVDIGNLRQKRSELFDQIEILEEVIEAKEYEPEGLEKILLDWARHENELEGAEFLDPLGFFIPVFGVGDVDADIMMIDQSPVYPLGEDTDPIRARSRIRGPRPNITEWSLEDLREFNSSLVRDGNIDGVWDVLGGIAEATESDTEEMYYTTLQKDGRFDESEEVIGDGFDPADLNRSSISAWKPYLQEEIDTVDPALIIIFSETSLRALVDILSVIEDESADDIPSGETYVLDRYPIIWFKHYSHFDPPGDTNLQEYVKDEFEGVDW